MGNRLFDLGLGVVALTMALPAYAASGHLTQSTRRAPKTVTRGAVMITPTAASQQSQVAPSASRVVRMDGVLLAVLHDSVVVERQMDPAMLRQWARSGVVPRGVTNLASINTIAIIEDRVYERIYFDGGTIDRIEDMKQQLSRQIRAVVRLDPSARKFLIRLKP